eukprot:COSAG01_NODE_3116_length_6565_cov_2.533406_10_plen_54_part_00
MRAGAAEAAVAEVTEHFAMAHSCAYLPCHEQRAMVVPPAHPIPIAAAVCSASH